MKGLAIILSVLLILSHALTEVHSLILFLWPETEHISIDWFWSPTYHMDLNILWYIKMSMDDICWCTTFFVMAKIAYRYSFKLFLIACIFFGYHVIDTVLFWYNYKSSYFVYYFLLGMVIISVLILILPMRKKTGKYKSLI